MSDPAFETLRLEPEPGARIVADHLPGGGPPLVFLHGLSSVRVGDKSEALFAYAAEQGRAAWRVDFRGHGQSSGTLGDNTLSELIADARCLLERSGPALLIGSSLGGLVASWTAAEHPELVRGLLLLAPAFRFLPRVRDRMQPDGRIQLDYDAGEVRLSERVLRDLAGRDEDRMAARIRVPLWLAHGDCDDSVPLDASERFFGLLHTEPRRLDVIAGGDHRLSREFPSILERSASFFAS